MAIGKKTGGRKKGVPNRKTQMVKDALIEAFDARGGVKGLVEWANDNPTEFYKLWAKIMPVQVNAKVDGGFQITVATGVPLPGSDD